MKKLDIKLIKNPKFQTKHAPGTVKVENKKTEGSIKDKKRPPETKVNSDNRKNYILHCICIYQIVFFFFKLIIKCT